MFLVAEFEKVKKKCRSNLLWKLYEKNWEKLDFSKNLHFLNKIFKNVLFQKFFFQFVYFIIIKTMVTSNLDYRTYFGSYNINGIKITNFSNMWFYLINHSILMIFNFFWGGNMYFLNLKFFYCCKNLAVVLSFSVIPILEYYLKLHIF